MEKRGEERRGEGRRKGIEEGRSRGPTGSRGGTGGGEEEEKRKKRGGRWECFRRLGTTADATVIV